MKAQTLYDLREEYGFCSGTDLHQFFRRTVGEPSPSGRVEVPTAEAKAFMIAAAQERHYPNPVVQSVEAVLSAIKAA